jgi:TerC family integral membrane protein
MDHIWLWVAFNALVLGLLALDLFVFNKEAHEISPREAALTSLVWVALAIVFGGWLAIARGVDVSLEYFAGYVIEKTLSVDNLFVFVLIFGFFRVPASDQHRVLFWGILGALVMRGVMIAAGSYLIHHFHWIVYGFGAFLIFSGIRMARDHGLSFNPGDSFAFRIVNRLVPVTSEYHGHHFFVRQGPPGARRLVATPLFVVLVLVEATDLIFAVDSIPAVFAVTDDPFVVYSSNFTSCLPTWSVASAT